MWKSPAPDPRAGPSWGRSRRRRLQHVRDETCADGLARLLVWRVEYRGQRRDPLRRGEASAIDPDEQLDEVPVTGWQAVDDEHVRAAPPTPRSGGVRLPVREGLQLHASSSMPSCSAIRGKLGVGAAGYDGKPLLRRQRQGAPDCELRSRGVGPLEARQRLLNRPAFHLVLPC
jgi:hypothetical protein